jgi:hypothetical protein
MMVPSIPMLRMVSPGSFHHAKKNSIRLDPLLDALGRLDANGENGHLAGHVGNSAL